MSPAVSHLLGIALLVCGLVVVVHMALSGIGRLDFGGSL